MLKQVKFTGQIAALAALLVTAETSASRAQDATYLSPDAGYCEIFRALSRVVPTECGRDGERAIYVKARNRGLVKLGGKEAQTAEAQIEETHVEAVEQATPPADLAATFRVEFAFDSDELTAEAKQILDRVASVIGSELMDRNFVQIEGHADATGTEAYNTELSQRRAVSVRSYLVERHGLDGNRLMSVGKGESELFDPEHPTAGTNRRVEVVNLNG